VALLLSNRCSTKGNTVVPAHGCLQSTQDVIFQLHLLQDADRLHFNHCFMPTMVHSRAARSYTTYRTQQLLKRVFHWLLKTRKLMRLSPFRFLELRAGVKSLLNVSPLPRGETSLTLRTFWSRYDIVTHTCAGTLQPTFQKKREKSQTCGRQSDGRQ
jgi:hypothetical protein